MKKSALFLLVCGLLSVVVPGIALAQGQLAQSDTYTVTNADAVISITNYPGENMAQPWYIGGIVFRQYDAATGALLQVEHVRSGVTNYLINTGATISVTNVLFVSNTLAAVTTGFWIPLSDWPFVPTRDTCRITTASSNCVLQLNRKASR